MLPRCHRTFSLGWCIYTASVAQSSTPTGCATVIAQRPRRSWVACNIQVHTAKDLLTFSLQAALHLFIGLHRFTLRKRTGTDFIIESTHALVGNAGKEGKKTATAMHQSHFTYQNDLSWAGCLFRNKGIWNSDHARTRSHRRRVKVNTEQTPKYTQVSEKKVTFDLGTFSRPTLTDCFVARGRCPPYTPQPARGSAVDGSPASPTGQAHRAPPLHQRAPHPPKGANWAGQNRRRPRCQITNNALMKPLHITTRAATPTAACALPGCWKRQKEK